MLNDKDTQILFLKDTQILWTQLKKISHFYCTGLF